MILTTTLGLFSPLLYFICICILLYYCWIYSFLPNNSLEYFKSKAISNVSNFNTHFLVRLLILRSLGFIYFAAFAAALYQYNGLWSDTGILPVKGYMEILLKQANKKSQHWLGAFLIDQPTLLWFFDYKLASLVLKISLYIGLILSIYVTVGCNNYFILFALWFIKLSLVNVGQRFMGYGWHPQLLEFGFICIFLGDWNIDIFGVNSKKNIIESYNAPYLIILLLRLLLFRTMFEPGVGKIFGGDRSWYPDCTAMSWHYWTQPSVNVASYFLHNLPDDILIFFTKANHFIELFLPFAIFIGYFKIFCYIRYLSGIVFIVFQLILVFGGNYSYLSYLTMIQSLCAFDDQFFMNFFNYFCTKQFANNIHDTINISYGLYMSNTSYFSFKYILDVIFFIFIVYLSHKPLKTILTSKRASDYSFNQWHIVNGYAAFSHMTKDRHEIIILGSNDNQEWKEYGFKTKPGNVNKMPLSIAPIDWFLDWSLWFVPLSNYKYHPWFLRLLYKILQGNNDVISLLGYNPFPDRPPQFLKVVKYRYVFGYVEDPTRHIKTNSFWDCFNSHTFWWKRDNKEEIIRVIHLQSSLITKYIADDKWLTH